MPESPISVLLGQLHRAFDRRSLLRSWHSRLASAVETFPPDKLPDRPGRD